MSRGARRSLVLLVCLLLAGCASRVDTVCSVYRGSLLVDDYLARQPVRIPPDPMTEAQGRCVGRSLVAALERSGLGAPVGYKVALTSPPAQRAFGIDHPVAGVLLQGMLLPDGAAVATDWGARPVFEPDLMVRVRDAGIMAAGTPLEVLHHLDAVIPFIELADLALPPGTRPSLPLALAVNAGARLGVMGAPVPVEATPTFVEALAAMTVSAVDGSRRELARAPGGAILGHPLRSVIWLAAELKRHGRTLKPGDLVSLGSFARPAAPVAGDTVTLHYKGLAEAPLSVSVRFR